MKFEDVELFWQFSRSYSSSPNGRIATVMDRCNVSRPTAASWLNTLADNGMAQNVTTGRDRLFINREFLQLLVRREPAGRDGAVGKKLGTFSKHLVRGSGA
jgi:hypothetical protein